MFDIMVSRGGQSIPLELRGERNKEKNLDKESNWDSRELVENVGILVRDKGQKTHDKYNLHVKKPPKKDPKSPLNYKYGFRYGEKEEVKFFKPYKPLDHFNSIEKNLQDKNKNNFLRLKFDDQKKEIRLIMQVELDDKDEGEKGENNRLLKLESEKAKRLLESWLKIKLKEGAYNEKEDYEKNISGESENSEENSDFNYLQVKMSYSKSFNKKTAICDIDIIMRPFLNESGEQEAHKAIDHLGSRLSKIVYPYSPLDERPNYSDKKPK